MQVRKPLLVIVLSLSVIGPVRPASAQALTFSLFERYVESLRQQSDIPGLSAAIVRGGSVVWERGFGLRDVDANLPATPDTPYAIGDLSQVFGATVLLETCYDRGSLELRDRVIRWTPFADGQATIEDLLSHTGPAGVYQYDLGRFAALSAVVEQCANAPYPQVLAREVFDRFGMASSVPGTSVEALSAAPRATLFTAPALAQYTQTLQGMAAPYRIDRGRPVRVDATPVVADASTGIVTSVRDLARFHAALRAGALLDPATLTLAWTQSRARGAAVPMGLGWFVQNYEGEPVIWQFGLVKDGFSSLLLHLPNRDLTLLLAANSDGLSAPFALQNGDVTTSIFAKLFLRLFAV